MKKLIFAAFLLTLLIALASGAAAEVWVGNVRVDVTAPTDYRQPQPLYGGTVQFVNNTLTLNHVTVPADRNYNYDGAHGNDFAYAIYIDHTAPVTIELVNYNTLQGAGSTQGTSGVSNSAGIYSRNTNTIHFTGSGILNAAAATAKVSSAGIFVNGDVTITDCTINASGLRILGSTGTSYGMRCHHLVVNRGSNVVLNGGIAGSSYGLFANGSFQMNGGLFAATSADASLLTVGLYCEGGVTLDAGDVFARTGKTISSDGNAIAILCQNLASSVNRVNIDVNAGKLVADGNTGHAPGTDGIGIVATGSVTIKNGASMTARGETSASRVAPSDFLLSGTWYEWKAAASYGEPTGAFTKSAVLPFDLSKRFDDQEWMGTDQYIQIRPITPDPVPTPDAPATGDGMNPAFWVALLLLSGAGVTLLLARRRLG